MRTNRVGLALGVALFGLSIASGSSYAEEQRSTVQSTKEPKREAKDARKHERQQARTANRSQLKQLDKGAFKQDTDRTDSPYETQSAPKLSPPKPTDKASSAP